LRQQQLERLGWTFHRIWSTDWFLRRDEEIERTIKAFHKAVEKSDRKKVLPLEELPANSPPGSPSDMSSPNRRSSPQAPIPVRESIGEYTSTEMQNLLRWVKSDGRLRTNEELADEMFTALPFSRRGSKIEAALQRAIARG
jgi:hypothetical protein